MLPLLADDMRAIAQAKKGRTLVPLLIQRDIEQANLNAAAVQVTIQRKDLALREALVEAAMDQAVTYVEARRRVADLMACKEADIVGDLAKCQSVDKTETFHALWNDLEPMARRVLLESITLYVDGFSRQQVKLDTMTTQYLALAREQTVELAEVHASMWAALIGASVTQAAEFAALGIKVEQIEKILNLLGIFYIGYGVNN